LVSQSNVERDRRVAKIAMNWGEKGRENETSMRGIKKVFSQVQIDCLNWEFYAVFKNL
jgi:hypothetical protein